jgi:hypothetical protein
MAASKRRPLQIKSYQFGKIEIGDDIYHKDVILFPGRVIPDWWREQGHSLSIKDLEDVFAEDPEILIIGLGRYSRMKIPKETKDYIIDKGIELIALSTQEACEQYNQLADRSGVIAALHLTC